MPWTQHFIVEGNYLGNTARGRAMLLPDPTPPISFAYFCPLCAEVWARCPVDKAAAPDFQVWTKPCRKCHTWWAVSGSLYIPLQDEYNNSFPRDVLLWEFDRHLESLEAICE